MELRNLIFAHRLMMLYICTKFRENNQRVSESHFSHLDVDKASDRRNPLLFIYVVCSEFLSGCDSCTKICKRS